VAASRVPQNPDIAVQAMSAGHTHATLARLRAPEVGWLGQDATFLNDGATPPKAGMGPVKINTRAADLLQPTVAFTPARVT
jgi:hypothetical protein